MAAGSIIIDLIAKTGSFQTDMKRASKGLDDFKKNAVVIGKAVGAAFASFAIAGAASIKTSIENQDAMIKTARSAGVTVEEFSRLAYAANLSGVGQDQLGTALVRLSKNMSDAQQGTGEAIKSFDALGISVKNQDGTLKGSGETLTEVAAKLSKYEDGAEKTALAVGIFGKAGADLIPLLNGGAEGIAQFAAEADRLGVTLDTKTAMAAEQFNDNLTRLNGVADGLKNQIAAELLPTLVNMTDAFFESAAGSAILSAAAKTAAAAVKVLVSAGLIVGGVFKLVGQLLGGVAAIAVQLFQGNFKQALEIGKDVVFDFADNVVGTVKTIGSVWDSEAKKIEGNSETLGAKIAAPLIKAKEKATKAAKEVKDETIKIYEDIEKQIKAIQDRVNKEGLGEVDAGLYDLSQAGATPEQLERAAEQLGLLEEYRLAKEAIVEQEEAQAKELDRINQLLGATPTAQLEALQDDMIFLRELFEEGRISLEQFNEAVSTRIGSVTEDAKIGFEDLERAIDGFAKNAAQSVTDFAFGAKSSFTDMINSFLKDLARLALQRGIFDPLTKGLGDGGFGSFFSGIFGGAKAGGGPVKAGQVYNVGELGPEKFVPYTNGVIVPNGGDSNSTMINVSVDASGSSVQGDSARSGELGNKLAEAIRAVLTDERRRGGLLA